MVDHEPATVATSRHVLAAIMLAVGIGAAVLSFAWTSISSGRSKWSNEQARKYQTAAAKLHGLSHEYAHQAREGNERGIRDRLAKAQAEYESLHALLESAIARPKQVAWALRVVGILLMAAGALGLFRGRTTRRSSS